MAVELWGWVLWYQKQNLQVGCQTSDRPNGQKAYLHRMKFCVRGFSFSQFYGSDAETPNISFIIIAALFDNFRRHPVRRPYECVLLRGQRARQLSRDTKVGEFHFPSGGKKNICSCSKSVLLSYRGVMERLAYL
jgi:hypothetical protein